MDYIIDVESYWRIGKNSNKQWSNNNGYKTIKAMKYTSSALYLTHAEKVVKIGQK